MKNPAIQKQAFETMVRACARNSFTLVGVLENWYPVLYGIPYNESGLRATVALSQCRKKFRELIKEKGVKENDFPVKKKKPLKKKLLKKKKKGIKKMDSNFPQNFEALANEKKFTDEEISDKIKIDVNELKKHRKKLKGNLPTVIEFEDGEREIFEA